MNVFHNYCRIIGTDGERGDVKGPVFFTDFFEFNINVETGDGKEEGGDEGPEIIEPDEEGEDIEIEEKKDFVIEGGDEKVNVERLTG